MSALGNHLKARRIARGFTLRQVEEITEGKVSNGYLSQLETGAVKTPSAIMLHRLSAALGLDFGELMEIAVGMREPPAPALCPTCGQPT